MKRLEIEATNNTPHVVLDATTNTFLIEGKSFPEDSKEFFRPLIEWVDEYKSTKPSSFKINFNLLYLSSSSVISIKQVLQKISDIQTQGAKITVVWNYDGDDDDIKKTGEDYQKVLKIDFQFKINL
jgi:hypothetical protein